MAGEAGKDDKAIWIRLETCCFRVHLFPLKKKVQVDVGRRLVDY